MERIKCLILALILVIGAAAFQLLGCERPPSPPTGLNAEVQQGKVILTWTDNSDDEKGFRVYRRPYGTGEFDIIATLGQNAVRHEDNVGLEKDYEYEVSAFNDNGESYSPIVRARTAPIAPTNLKLTNPTEGDIVLSWTDNATVEEGYEIWRRTVGDGGWGLVTNALPPDTITYTDSSSSLYCINSYEYELKAFVRNGSKVIYSESVYGTGNPCEKWSFQTVEDPGDNFGIIHTSIAVHGDTPHISYYIYYCPTGDFNNCGTFKYRDLKYATGGSKGWQTTTIQWVKIIGLYNSIAVDDYSRVHITSAVAETGELRYHRLESGSWTGMTLDRPPIGDHAAPVSNRGLYSTVAVGNCQPMTCIYASHADSALTVRFVKMLETPGKQAQIEAQIVDSGTAPSLALDSTNTAHIAYLSISTPTNLKYATNPSGVWQISTIEASAGAQNPSIAVSGGRIHIAYYDVLDHVLKYATNTSRRWQIYAIDSLGDPASTCSTAIAAGPRSDIAHIVYCAPGGLRYATNKSGAWKMLYLDVATPFYESSLDIALSAGGNVHISYTPTSNLHNNFILKYARGIIDYNKK